MNTITRSGSVCANRHSGGRTPEGFCLQVFDDDSSACVEVWFTPEQWALSMWGRASIPVKVNWIDVPTAMTLPTTVSGEDPRVLLNVKRDMLEQAKGWRHAASQPGMTEVDHERCLAKADALEEFAQSITLAPPQEAM